MTGQEGSKGRPENQVKGLKRDYEGEGRREKTERTGSCYQIGWTKSTHTGEVRPEDRLMEQKQLRRHKIGK
jgi:hypothetical protein